MRQSFTQRLAIGLLAVFLLSYVGYQVYRYNESQYKTETTYLYSVSESTRVTGLVLRKESILSEQIKSGGIATYAAADGTRVSKGSLLAEVYQSQEDIDNIHKMRELSNRRKLLEMAQDPGSTSYAHADVLNKQIFTGVSNIIGAVEKNELRELSNMSDRLLVLMNTKQIATGKQENFNSEIEQLAAEEKYYRDRITKKPEEILSPRQGYFLRRIDGFENAVDLTQLQNLDAQTLFNLINTPAQNIKSNHVGKLMTDHNWYYAVIVSEDKIANFREGAAVTLDFNISGLSPIPATIKHINTSEKDPNSVVVFQCDYINEALCDLRVSQATVTFKSVSGLRISNSAIRFSGIQKGVYVVQGEKLVFRPITVIHEDVGFVLCREYDDAYNNKGSYEGLQQYDEVVTEGGKLYDKQLREQ